MIGRGYTATLGCDANTVQFGQHYDNPTFADFVAEQMRLEENLCKLSLFLTESRLFTDKKTKVYVSWDPSLNDFVIFEDHPDNLIDINIRAKECNDYEMINYILDGFVGKVECEGDKYEQCKFYIAL